MGYDADFAAAMEEMHRRSCGAEQPPLDGTLLEAALMDLAAAFERYAADCPFEPGDIVTPRRGMNLQREGQPAVVLEVLRPRPEPLFLTTADGIHSTQNGQRLDIRVLQRSDDGAMVPFWAESFRYQPWPASAATPEGTTP